MLLRLIGALYQDYDGTILYNDVPQKNIQLSSLHALIGDSFEREDIFRGTLLENLTVGRDNITFEEIKTAIKVTSLEDFVNHLPNGYETDLYPAGQGLPSNIIRKIKLARCVIGKPKLIFISKLIMNHFDRSAYRAIFVNRQKCLINSFDIAHNKQTLFFLLKFF